MPIVPQGSVITNNWWWVLFRKETEKLRKSEKNNEKRNLQQQTPVSSAPFFDQEGEKEFCKQRNFFSCDPTPQHQRIFVTSPTFSKKIFFFYFTSLKKFVKLSFENKSVSRWSTARQAHDFLIAKSSNAAVVDKKKSARLKKEQLKIITKSVREKNRSVHSWKIPWKEDCAVVWEWNKMCYCVHEVNMMCNYTMLFWFICRHTFFTKTFVGDGWRDLSTIKRTGVAPPDYLHRCVYSNTITPSPHTSPTIFFLFLLLIASFVICDSFSFAPRKNIENLGILYFVIMISLQRQNQQNKSFPLSSKVDKTKRQ